MLEHTIRVFNDRWEQAVEDMNYYTEKMAELTQDLNKLQEDFNNGA